MNELQLLLLLINGPVAIVFLAYYLLAYLVFARTGNDPKSLREVARLSPWPICRRR